MRIMGEMSGKTASEGGFVILNGSKRAKKCKNRMNPENSSPNETRNGAGGECADAEHSAAQRASEKKIQIFIANKLKKVEKLYIMF